MNIAIVTFDGFNEIDSFVALNILNRVKRPDWKAEIVCPTASVVSMNGVRVYSQRPFTFVNEADGVLIGSGTRTQEIIQDQPLMSALHLDPHKQLVSSQCSGALVLSHLGFLNGRPACTDLSTRPVLEEMGIRVLDQPFYADGNIAMAGGCLAAQYLAAWFILQGVGQDAAAEALAYVAPVGQKEEYVKKALETISRGTDSTKPVLT